MRRLIIVMNLILLLSIPVCAEEFVPPEVPSSGQEFMPYEIKSFSDGLQYVLGSALSAVHPDLLSISKICFRLIAIVLLISILKSIAGKKVIVIEWIGALTVGYLLFSETDALIDLGVQTVRELSDYGKLLLPMMTGALAAQGGVTSSAALYAGTAAFDAVLSNAISLFVLPMIYVVIAFSISYAAAGEESLKKMRDLVKWLASWIMKIILYVFTGYISITGVINGSADAAAVKAAKITISGMIPVVGGILSDASEAVVISTGEVKNAAGVYGVIAILAV